jgi:hypothetical protein
MNCQRCGNDKEAEFRVVSDVMDNEVCADCAREARRFGMALQVLEIDKAETDQSDHKPKLCGHRMNRATPMLVVLVLVSSLITGCGCLAADSYDKPACQKYDTEWQR